MNASQDLRWIEDLKCPACERKGLFVASGGYITCSQSDCPNPDYVAALQAREKRIRIETVRIAYSCGYLTEAERDSMIAEFEAALTPKSIQQRTIDFVTSPQTHQAAAEGAMEKRAEVMNKSTEPDLDPERDFGPGGILGPITPQASTAKPDYLKQLRKPDGPGSTANKDNAPTIERKD